MVPVCPNYLGKGGGGGVLLAFIPPASPHIMWLLPVPSTVDMVTITSFPRVAPADSIWAHIINDVPSMTVAIVDSAKEAAAEC